MTDYSHIIERLEKAEGPDRELDTAIADLLLPRRLQQFGDQSTDDGGWEPYYQNGYLVGDGWHSHPPGATRSIDAALALVEAKLPGWMYGIVRKGGIVEGYVHNNKPAFIGLYAEANPARRWLTARHKAPAIALLLALLLALQEMEQAHG
jgi:hypothetical protein